MAIAMPGEGELPAGARRDLVEAFHRLYTDAGCPAVGPLSRAMQQAASSRRDPASPALPTPSHETIAKLLRGKAVPAWDLLQVTVEHLARRSPHQPDVPETVKRFHDVWKLDRAANPARGGLRDTAPLLVTAGRLAQACWADPEEAAARRAGFGVEASEPVTGDLVVEQVAARVAELQDRIHRTELELLDTRREHELAVLRHDHSLQQQATEAEGLRKEAEQQAKLARAHAGANKLWQEHAAVLTRERDRLAAVASGPAPLPSDGRPRTTATGDAPDDPWAEPAPVLPDHPPSRFPGLRDGEFWFSLDADATATDVEPDAAIPGLVHPYKYGHTLRRGVWHLALRSTAQEIIVGLPHGRRALLPNTSAVRRWIPPPVGSYRPPVSNLEPPTARAGQPAYGPAPVAASGAGTFDDLYEGFEDDDQPSGPAPQSEPPPRRVPPPPASRIPAPPPGWPLVPRSSEPTT